MFEKCPKCHRPTTVEDYHNNKSSASGKAYNCKKCMSDTAKAHYKAKKREKVFKGAATAKPRVDIHDII